MSESIEHAFQALQTALISLERTVSERAEMMLGESGQADAGKTDTSGALSADEKQAVQDELLRLKSLVSEASGLILSSRNSSGAG